MVSTRRTAQTEPQVELDLDANLKKKPIRRPAKRADPEVKPKPVRGKKVEPASKAGPKETEEAKSDKKQITTRPKPAAKRLAEKPSRATAPEAKKSAANPSRATRATKNLEAQKDSPILKAPAEEPPVRRTRAAATKARPLSPKKITQVTRPPSRTTKAKSRKIPTEKAGLEKQAVPRTRATKKRAISNENAETPQEQTVAEGGFPSHSRSKHLQRETNQYTESEKSFSSRPTTPSEIGAPDAEEDEDELMGGNNQDKYSESEGTAAEDVNDSEDELCGPKTPMKRSSPTAHARYLASMQRTGKAYHSRIPDRTPPRRVAGSGATPSTQQQASLVVAPKSDRRPLTVERGTERAFVFRDLRSFPTPEELHEDVEDSDQDDFTMFEGVDKRPLNNNSSVPASTFDEEAETEDVEDSILGSVALSDPDATVLVPCEDEMGSGEVGLAIDDEDDSSIDTVLICPMDQELDDVEEYMSDIECDIDENVVPQTMVWENIRQDVTLHMDFDAHFANANMLPQSEPTECLNIALEGLVNNHRSENLHEGTKPPDSSSLSTPLMDKGGSIRVTMPSSRRETFNLTEYIDASALAEASPTKSAPKDDIVMEDVEYDADATVVERASAKEKSVKEGAPTNAAVTPVRPKEQVPDPAPASVQSGPNASPQTPHYALPTFAFDVRRKSVPAISFQTPIKLAVRPNTSNGASMPRTLVSFVRGQAQDATEIAMETPMRLSRSNTRPARDDGSPYRTLTPVPERYPRLNQQQCNKTRARSVVASRRFKTPVSTPLKRPATTQKFRTDESTLMQKNLRSNAPKVLPGETEFTDSDTPLLNRERQTEATVPSAASPVQKSQVTPVATPKERFPRLPARQDYEEHANTVTAPARFSTPVHASVKRPKTVQKPTSLRKLALKARTPMKTPLKAPALTPGQVPMTPHPAAPLRGVTAMVEVFTLEGASASAPFVALLHRLGARTTKTWSERVTHVVYKDGSPTTLQKIRVHNKEVAEGGHGTQVYCINSRWVSDCDAEGRRVDEEDEIYGVDMAEIPRGGQRRRKSMEPGVFQNIGGNVVRDRTSSWGKNSLRRSLAKIDSPAGHTSSSESHTTPRHSMVPSPDPQDSPETPDWLHPEKLIQQTAPLKRIRKLDLASKENRRMTGADGVFF